HVDDEGRRQVHGRDEPEPRRLAVRGAGARGALLHRGGRKLAGLQVRREGGGTLVRVDACVVAGGVCGARLIAPWIPSPACERGDFASACTQFQCGFERLSAPELLLLCLSKGEVTK